MRKKRSNPEGRKEYNEYQKELMKKVHNTPKGKKEYNEYLKEFMKKVRNTPEEKNKHNEDEKERNRSKRCNPEEKNKHNDEEKERNRKKRCDPEERERHNEEEQIRMANLRETRKAELRQKVVENNSFPPKFTDDIEKKGIENYIRNTSFSSLETVECGICGEAVRNNSDCVVEKPIYDIPNRDLLSAEDPEDPNRVNLEEYVHDAILLSPGGNS